MKLNKHECVTNLLVTAESNELVAIARTQTLRERERERERESCSELLQPSEALPNYNICSQGIVHNGSNGRQVCPYSILQSFCTT
jgi:hypothetical protein